MKLTQQDISNVISVIAKGYQPERIFLFGSSAKGNISSSSDIDLLIIKQTDETFYKRPLKVHALFNPYLYNLDVHIYTPQEFEDNKVKINTIAYTVNKTGRIVYESGS